MHTAYVAPGTGSMPAGSMPGAHTTITGCWRGALVADQGGGVTSFAYRQPPRDGVHPDGPTLALGDGTGSDTDAPAPLPAHLLDGAPRAIVALVDGARDPESGDRGQLLLEARVRGDALVGHWMRRDREGRVLATGSLTASRADV